MKNTLILLLLLTILAGCRDTPPATTPTSPTPVENALRDAPATVVAATPLPSRTPTTAAPTVTSPTATPTALSQAPSRVTTTPQFTDPTGTPTPATATPNPATYGLGDSYQLYVSYAFEPPTDQAQGEGQRQVVVAATVANQDGAPVLITASSIFLVGSDGRIYSPDEESNEHTPALLGAELLPGESFLGLLPFNLPTEVTPAQLTWCPGGNGTDCALPLQAPVP